MSRYANFNSDPYRLFTETQPVAQAIPSTPLPSSTVASQRWVVTPQDDPYARWAVASQPPQQVAPQTTASATNSGIQEIDLSKLTVAEPKFSYQTRSMLESFASRVMQNLQTDYQEKIVAQPGQHGVVANRLRAK